jgi:hypothetical protein
MDDAEDLERRQIAWAAIKARAHETLRSVERTLAECEAERKSKAATVANSDLPPEEPEDPLLRWQRQMSVEQPDDSHKKLRQSITELKRDIASLRDELAAVRAEAAETVNVTTKQICEAVGAQTAEIEGGLLKKITKLAKRIDSLETRKQFRVVA